MRESLYLTLVDVLAGIVIVAGLILLACVIGGANRRRRKDPVRALSGSLPPEHSAKYEYSTSAVVILCIFVVALFWLMVLLSPVLFPNNDPIPLWVNIGLPVLLAFLVVLYFLINGRCLTFDEKELVVEKCGVLYDGNRISAKKQSFNIAWSEIESVDYSRKNIVIITTTGGCRMGVRPFLYSGGAMRGCNTVEIGMRIDYYAHYFGHGEQDIKRMSDHSRYPIEVDALFAYAGIGVVVCIVISLLGSFISSDSGEYDPLEYLQSNVENTLEGLPYALDSTLTFSDVQLDDNYYTEVYECNENYYNMDTLQQMLADDPGNLIDLNDSNTIQLFSLLKDANRGYCAKYIGTTSGKTASFCFELEEL